MLELGLVDSPTFTDNEASMGVQLSCPGPEIQQEIRTRIEQVLAPFGITKLNIHWDLKVPIRQLASEDPVPHVRNIVLVMSGKGGVGKSTCAANIAVALGQAGAKVGLLDADIYGPSVPTLFGVHEAPTSEDGKLIRPLEKHGVKLMSIGFLMDDPTQAVVWRGPMLHGALMQFIKDVDWGELDYLVLDLPPGTGDVALTLAQHAKVTGALIVTTPQELALQDVYKAVSMCKKLNLTILGVIENMSHFIDSAGVSHALFGSGGGAKVAAFAGAHLLSKLPIDPEVGQCNDSGVPVVAAKPNSAIAKAYSKLAQDLTVRIARHLFEMGGGQKAPSTDGPRRLRIMR
ncbi:MAG: Mrp/NBP35 family ATP-binding protein [Myxococcales bacterium]|nr:MAG: Mrp/NBP35 family ATP-binding protein [Myxococcales bacterium]